jgi:UDP-GlcNAc:undecaprenyl-phosphate/decaprenyl-phosphate GlcNAc-1-phosphate transferase
MDISFTLIKDLILVPMGLAFGVSFLATPVVIKIYTKMGWVEDPQKSKKPTTTHTQPVPRGGGIPIYLALLIATIVLLPLDLPLRGILIGGGLIALLGVVDDRFDPSPYLRLTGLFLAAGIVVAGGIYIQYITNPFDGIINLLEVLAIPLTLLWIVSLTTVIDWVKGFDGQLPGIVVVSALTIAFLALRFSADITQWPVAILASITAGAYLGFLPFNFYPQKIMPGFGGGTLAGFLLAILAILSTTKILTAMVVLGIPIADAFYSFSRRIANGKSPVWGDRGHLHHRILDEWHWSKPKTAIFYWLATAFLGTLALNLNSRQKIYTIIMLAILVGALLLWLNFFSALFGRSGRGKPSKT